MNAKDKLKQILSPRQSLSQRAVRGGIWVFALRITTSLLGLACTIVLARVLAPNDFGLMGIALLAMSALETFSQTGFDTALIQKKENTEAYLDTGWTVQAIRGILLFGILFAAAPLVAMFFNTQKATAIVRVIAVTELLKGFTNIGVIYFKKELEFNKQFLYQFSGTLADLTVAILAALTLRSVWALVFGLLAGQFVRLIMSYVIHPYRPRLGFNQRQFKELFGFGKWIFGSSILVFLVTQGDDILVGKLLGVVALGFYQMAYSISNMPATEIAHVVSQVSFPAFSKLQDNSAKLGEAYLKVLQLTAFISIPLAGLIFILAPEFTKIFLGEKWMPMVPAMQVLVLAGLLRSIAATPIFSSVGKPRIETAWQTTRLVVLAVFIYPFTIRWGILGASVSVFFSNFVSTIGFNFMAIKITQCGAKSFGKVVVLTLINGIIMVLSISALKIAGNTVGSWIFFLLVGVGVLTYLGIACLLDRFLNYRIRLLIKWCLISLR